MYRGDKFIYGEYRYLKKMSISKFILYMSFIDKVLSIHAKYVDQERMVSKKNKSISTMYSNNTYKYGKYSDFKRNIHFEINSIHIMYKNRRVILFFNQLYLYHL